ncbi:hypothetical protein [Phytoactinopolyspora limicola]|uniref:hypothetical protein n=1 Tax=Phytoactinopolyspora limicola TaxID=2715536 RepID=UPI00140A92D4|nr:hypothetical protein [Phytoactinopolyspora limicola]
MIKSLGERRGQLDASEGFLTETGFANAHGLTELGSAVFRAVFIEGDETAKRTALRKGLMRSPLVLAICQALFGVPNATKANAEAALRYQALSVGLTDRTLGTLLTMMAEAQIITYKRGIIYVLDSPFAEGEVPRSVFISRETPFSNVLWLTRVLRECDGHIYWLDKHFQASGFEALADAAEGSRINVIRILSLKLDGNSSPRVRKKYQSLQQELAHKGIDLQWRFIDSKLIRDTHDRWIIGEISARNVPDVGTIMSGNHSEISLSDHASKLNQTFDDYWKQGTPV